MSTDFCSGLVLNFAFKSRVMAMGPPNVTKWLSIPFLGEPVFLFEETANITRCFFCFSMSNVGAMCVPIIRR